jgi:hypothetical protein
MALHGVALTSVRPARVQADAMNFNALERLRSFHKFIHREKIGDNNDELFGPTLGKISKYNINRLGLPFWQLFSGCGSGNSSMPAETYAM